MNEGTIAAAPDRREAIGAIGATGLALLGALGLANTADAGKKRKKGRKKGSRGAALATRVVFSEFSDPLPVAAGSLVEAFADCGGAGKVVSCGYNLNAVAATAVNTAVLAMSPAVGLEGCVVSLLRTAEAGSSPGAQVQATAICLK